MPSSEVMPSTQPGERKRGLIVLASLTLFPLKAVWRTMISKRRLHEVSTQGAPWNCSFRFHSLLSDVAVVVTYIFSSPEITFAI